MLITDVTFSQGNLHFGFTNNNTNSALFIFNQNSVVDTGDFVEEGLSLNIKASEVSKELSSCLRTISTVTYDSTVYLIQSSISCPNLFFK